VYRGHLDRRAAKVERGLKRIANTHQITLSEALRPWKGVKVFWYKRKAEQQLLYRNYRLLVERTGNDPPLHRVENNIHMLHERIHILECRRAALIQKRVRGMIGRMFIRQYRVERGHVTAKQCAAAFKIQRSFRVWVARRVRHVLQQDKMKREIGQRYLEERERDRQAQRRRHLKEKLNAAYKQDTAEDRCAQRHYSKHKDAVAVTLRAKHTVPAGKRILDWQQNDTLSRNQKERAMVSAQEKHFRSYDLSKTPFAHAAGKSFSLAANRYVTQLQDRVLRFNQELAKKK
jgi:hypothetical protein